LQPADVEPDRRRDLAGGQGLATGEDRLDLLEHSLAGQSAGGQA
jgi:hypothetical protein